ncbi:MAG: type I-U CRISPR-associated helicase/endonuclease Cas3 [Blastocatellia bacterium]|nr:type I-U CRISPR-associated helicase/endonuclease Cas3 [Blastocatellia bacterium]
MNLLNFDSTFEALMGYKPLRWQTRLYNRLRMGDIPPGCDLPTGLGKSSVIPIWLIAFASQIIEGKISCLPRRLIYIVNRRTVVDQATQIAERLRHRILGQVTVNDAFVESVNQLKLALQKATAVNTDLPIAISTLRGELADNQEWKTDPARPSIIVGTIDMIGSKLLFSGYGDSYRVSPQHAGLVGQDTLIVHDEAHLTPAFGKLLHRIAEEQQWFAEPRRLYVMELSATPSAAESHSPIRLEQEDELDELVPQKLDAEKRLFFPGPEATPLPEQAIKRALKYQSLAVKVLIYVRSPEKAKEIASGLEKALGGTAKQNVALLTGTVRGHERDQLVRDNLVYQALLQSQVRVEQTVYLVSTSAGEVGIDLDADHIICDLTTLDSMIQRFGRVNRLGGKGRKARIEVITEKKEETRKEETKPEKQKEPSPMEFAVANTEPMLKKLSKFEDEEGGYNASPRAVQDLLRKLTDEERDKSFAPKPAIVPVTDILFDAWALTTIYQELPGRPAVAPYLHGLTFDPPETYIAWRSEVKFLAEAKISPQRLREWFQLCRIEARERLHDQTSRIAKELGKIAKRWGDTPLPCVLLTERGEAELVSLQELLKRDASALQFCTLVLPVEANGLASRGMLDGGEKEAKDIQLDVTEAAGTRMRIILNCAGDVYWHHPLVKPLSETADANSPLVEQEYSSLQRAATSIARSYGKVVSEIIPLTTLPEDDEDEATAHFLLLLVEPKQAATENPELTSYEQDITLDDHLTQAGFYADKIARALRLEESLHDAVVIAAKWHDVGKNRRRWQHAIYNDDHNLFFAKSGPKGMDWRRLGGYRHEFGSLLDAAQASEIIALHEADLILHLIAAHHGRARPHFDPDGWDMERYTTAQNAEAAHEVMRRYARLQKRFGRWGLAWLESLVRCADVLASQQAAQQAALPPTKEDK